VSAATPEAVDLLLAMREETSDVLARAETLTTRLLAAPRADGLRTSYDLVANLGVLVDAAILDPRGRQDAVAERWLCEAEDVDDTVLGRAARLNGITNMAKACSEGSRRALYPRALTLAGPGAAVSTHDQMFAQSLHPLSLIRLDLGVDQLPASALLAASALCVDEPGPGHYALLEANLQSDDAGDVEMAVVSLGALEPRFRPGALVDRVLTHPSHRVRALATERLAAELEEAMLVTLARDEHFLVRARAAHALAERAKSEPWAETVYDELKGDPDARVRAAAGPGV
jgi:hypothetical protein